MNADCSHVGKVGLRSLAWVPRACTTTPFKLTNDPMQVAACFCSVWIGVPNFFPSKIIFPFFANDIGVFVSIFMPMNAHMTSLILPAVGRDN